MGLAVASCSQDYEIIQGPVDVDPGLVTECPFTPVSGTRFSMYDCNPVFVNTTEQWGQHIQSVGFRTQMVLGHPFYQMWYSAQATEEFGDWKIGYAVSNNGTDWEINPENPVLESDRNWDSSNADAIQVAWDPEKEEYLLAYQGYNLETSKWGLAVATSGDGVLWSYTSDRPALNFSQPVDNLHYCWPISVSHTSLGMKGYIAAEPLLNNGTPERNVCQIYPMNVNNAADWSVEDAVALEAGEDGAYDAGGMGSAAVVEFNGELYMFYSGFREWIDQGSYQSSNDSHLALATSSDGVTWIKDKDNPIKKLSLTKSSGLISDVAAQVVGSRIHLWITDYYEDIDRYAVGYFYYEPDIEPHE